MFNLAEYTVFQYYSIKLCINNYFFMSIIRKLILKSNFNQNTIYELNLKIRTRSTFMILNLRSFANKIFMQLSNEIAFDAMIFQ